MNALQFPWSGDVSQWINPMTSWFTGNTSSLVNVNYASSNPKVEEKIIRDVAGYGRQLGRITEVLEILVAMPEVKKHFTAKQQEVVGDFRAMAQAIADAKEEMAIRSLSPMNLRVILRDIAALKSTNPDLHKKLTDEIRKTLFAGENK